MKKHRKSKKFLIEVGKIPNVSRACEKLGISRYTIYRWRESDPDFRDEMDKALDFGYESMNDLAKMQHTSHLQKGAVWAIKYQLDNHDKNFIRPRPRDFWDNYSKNNKTRGFEVTIIQGKKRPTSTRDNIKPDEQRDDLSPI